MTSRSLLREPLVHFLALGGLLFGLVRWRAGPAGVGSDRITVGRGQIEALAAGFTRTWQRPPTERELKGLIDEYVREELAYREAVAIGLDRDDPIIRRRLRQKLEFLIEDVVDAVPPTDSALQNWLDAHADVYRTDPQVAFRQVYFRQDARGAAVIGDAQRVRARLERSGPDAPIADLGDGALLLPQEVPLASRTEVVRVFGEAFADSILDLEPGHWAGPVESGYGLHLVFVRERREGRLPPLDEIRAVVERDLMAAQRAARIEQMYERLLGRYRVDVQLADSSS